MKEFKNVMEGLAPNAGEREEEEADVLSRVSESGNM
jgi:hypothetical protein